MVHKRIQEFRGKDHYTKAQKYALVLAKEGYDFRLFTFPKDRGSIVLKLKKTKAMKDMMKKARKV